MWLDCLIIAILLKFLFAVELTFELPDNANQCFFEDLKAGIDCVVEFQVVTGGKYDVDVKIQGPKGIGLYSGERKHYDSFSFKTVEDGTYKVCFSNEFSTFSHKIVYMDWEIGGSSKTPQKASAMTSLESSSSGISDRLRVIDDYQTHHRLREAAGRKRAEDLNERVFLWSIGQSCVIIFIGVSQVIC